MPLNLYRRHGRNCTGGHDFDSQTYKSDEQRKTKKGEKSHTRCSCPIYASGVLAGAFKKKSTGATEWEKAEAIAVAWERTAYWDAKPYITTAPPQPSAVGTMIAEAVKAFRDLQHNRKNAVSTYRKYITFLNQLQAFCEDRGFVFTSQLSRDDIQAFYRSWNDGPRSAAKKLERLRAFVKFCQKRKWLDDDIADELRPPPGASTAADKSPFTDDELNRLYTACDWIGGSTPPGPGHRAWSGEDVKDFILVSVYTGLRISDVATFDISTRLVGNDVFLRMHKTRRPLYTWIDDWLVQRLRRREAKYGNMIFALGASRDVRTMAELWRTKLGRVFDMAGPFDQRPHPHRFRHTFVRKLLQKGVPVADVAELIGDSEEIIRKHYAKWVPELQNRLTDILRTAMRGDQPAGVATHPSV